MYNTPVLDALTQYTKKGYSQFFMPGHKGGEGIPSVFRLDLTELDETDNLHIPQSIFAEAQELLAKAYGAYRSYFLVNGSSGGIHAMLTTSLSEGDKVLVCSNCHVSLVSALIICGAEPVFFDAEYIPDAGVFGGISLSTLEAVILKNPDAKAVYITSPDYSGFCSDVKGICEITHRHGMLLLVDEAHGAHFGFADCLPRSSVSYGADIVVQSAHKTLPALTQSAYIHINNPSLAVRVKNALDLLLTSSPSYILTAYMDAARAIMQKDGQKIFSELFDRCSRFWDMPLDFAVGYEGKYSIHSVDKTRICVFGDYSDIDFRKYMLVPEMADSVRAVFLPSSGTCDADFERLYKALCEVKPKKSRFNMPAHTPTQVLSPRKAFFSETEQVRTCNSAGRISAVTVAPYPPGIPVLIPGSLITKAAIEYINAASADMFGENGMITVCK